MSEVILLVIMGIGVLFFLVGAIGMLKFEDVYLRLQASSKALTFGAGFFLAGAGFMSGDTVSLGKALLAVAFLFLTSPIAAHIIARSALRRGIVPVKVEGVDRRRPGPDDEELAPGEAGTARPPRD